MLISWPENSSQSLPFFPSQQQQQQPQPRKNMKITLTTYQIAGYLMQDDNAKWSRSGAYALADYLQKLEDSLGEEQDFDVVSIRCDFSEFSTAVEAAGEYGWSAEPDEYDDANESAALSWLHDRTSVITFNGGVIIATF